MIEIALGIALFTSIVMCLALVILAARSRLMPKGEALVVVNGETTLAVSLGGRLLDALVDAGIRMPSGCGGVGTCGLCRLDVLAGGGEILPVERERISRREAAEGARLACQVTVRGDLRVHVPDEIFGARQWTLTVRSVRSVSTLVREIVLDLPPGEEMHFRAGAFVQVTCPPYHARFADFDIGSAYRGEWDRLGLWRHESVCRSPETRAYSLANHPGEQDVMLNVRIALPPAGALDHVPPGAVSSYLFAVRPGDVVTVSGPYGSFCARETDAEMVFIGGGAGMAPMRSIILDQLERVGSDRTITFWYGARNALEVFYADEFDRLAAEHENFRWFVALSDPDPDGAWTGPTGFIHQVAYEHYLKDHRAPEDCEYYVCGPPVMILAVRSMLDGLGVEPENVLYDDFGG